MLKGGQQPCLWLVCVNGPCECRKWTTPPFVISFSFGMDCCGVLKKTFTARMDGNLFIIRLTT
ncbi:MAG: hypothetical protein CL932_01800 [Deltaproteobacteria bacterium]|nr:hypothetical protein [Deltaproteobacteria bacterium]